MEKENTIPKDRTRQRNVTVYCLCGLMIAIRSLLSVGTLFQNYLLHIGFSIGQVSLLAGTLPQAAQSAGILLMLLVADRIRKVLRIESVGRFGEGLLFLSLLLIPLLPDRKAGFWVLGAVIVAVNVLIGIRSVFDYKVPYLFFRLEEFGRLLSVGGIISNVVTSALGVLIPILLNRDYDGWIRVMQTICLFLVFVDGCLIFAYRTPKKEENTDPEQGGDTAGETPDASSAEEDKPTLRELFTHPAVRNLTIPNLLRGLSMGIYNCVTLIAVRVYDPTSAQLSVMVTVSLIGAILGCFLFTVIGKLKWLMRESWLTGIIYAVLFPMLVAVGSYPLFLGVWFCLTVVYNIICVLVPTVVYQIIPYRISGSYTSVRLVLTTGGTALGSAAAGWLLETYENSNFPVLLLTVAAGVLQLVSGIIYAAYLKKKRV